MGGSANAVYNENSNSIFYVNRPGKGTLQPGRGRCGRCEPYLKMSPQIRRSLHLKSREILLSRGLFERLFFCYDPQRPKEREVTPSIFRLIDYLGVVGPYTEGIFRREGNKNTTRKIVEEIVEFDKSGRLSCYDFDRYTVLELGSALKYYIRDVMNGLFDNVFLAKIFGFIQKNDHENTALYCKYLIFSFTDDQRRCFVALRKMFGMITQNKEVNKICWESICNIFSLTLCPQEAFTSIQQIPVTIELFRCMMDADIDDVNTALRILKI